MGGTGDTEWLQGANRGGDGCLDMVPRPHPGIQGTYVLPENVSESQQKKFRDHIGAGETAPRDVVNLNQSMGPGVSVPSALPRIRPDPLPPPLHQPPLACYPKHSDETRPKHRIRPSGSAVHHKPWLLRCTHLRCHERGLIMTIPLYICRSIFARQLSLKHTCSTQSSGARVPIFARDMQDQVLGSSPQ